MYRTNCITDSTFNFSATFQRCLDSSLDVPEVVQGIKYPDNINAVFNSTFNKLFYYIVRIVPVSNQVLSPEQHLERCMWHMLFQKSYPLPRIFLQISHT